MNKGESRDSGDMIQINCFGRLSICYGGQEMGVLMKSAKARELIAYLMTCRGAAVRKTAVCTALWENSSEKHGLDNLYKLVDKIQKMPIPFLIDRSKEMIQLKLDNVQSDLLDFLRLAKDADNIKNKKKAVQLYQASLFEEENYEWVSAKAAVYDNQVIEMLSDIRDYHLHRQEEKIANYYDRWFDIYL